MGLERVHSINYLSDLIECDAQKSHKLGREANIIPTDPCTSYLVPRAFCLRLSVPCTLRVDEEEVTLRRGKSSLFRWNATFPTF